VIFVLLNAERMARVSLIEAAWTRRLQRQREWSISFGLRWTIAMKTLIKTDDPLRDEVSDEALEAASVALQGLPNSLA
jgi:hypothetical protein